MRETPAYGFSVPYVLAAGLILLCALYALSLAGGLRHFGRWTMVGCAALLLSHALGLVTRRPVSWLFGASLATLASLAGLGYGGRMAYGAWMFDASDGWGGFAKVIGFFIGIALVLAGGALGVLATALWRRRDAVGETRGRAWIAAALGALVSLAELGWLAGYEYAYRSLPQRNACIGGEVLACADVASRKGPFDEDERRHFARLGCERGQHQHSCEQLLALLGPRHGAQSAEVQALAAACRKPWWGMCGKVGAHLLSIADLDGAAPLLAFACDGNAASCSSLADVARDGGAPALARRVLESGCRAEDGRSCLALLRRHGDELPSPDRDRLELRTCLAGEMAACYARMKRDLPGTCDALCRQPERYHCVLCAREAARRGDAPVARSFLEPACAQGYKFACEELGRTNDAPAPRRR